jgi:hypothetical protein
MLGSAALGFNTNLLNIAANNQTNSQLFHLSADRQKVLEEVSKIIAEKLKPRPKPKSKNTSGAYALAENIKYNKNGEPAKKRGPKPK